MVLKLPELKRKYQNKPVKLEAVKKQPKKTIIAHIRETVETLIVAFIIASVIKAFLFEIFYIPSGSMIPTLEIKDRLIVMKPVFGIQNPLFNTKHKKTFLFIIPNPLYHKELPFSDNKYIFKFEKNPNRNDVIVFYPPEKPVSGSIYYYTDQSFRKVSYFRPPQKPGYDYIKRIIGLPGELLELKSGYVYIDGKKIEEDNHLLNRDNANFGPVRIPEGHYFMMGDNRARSSDSRVWGFMPAENIVGKALLKIWPLNRVGIIR